MRLFNLKSQKINISSLKQKIKNILALNKQEQWIEWKNKETTIQILLKCLLVI